MEYKIFRCGNNAEEDEAAHAKTGINADALERARQFRQEFTAHHGDLPADLVAAARFERMNQIIEVLKI